jgi:hypothetical protein
LDVEEFFLAIDDGRAIDIFKAVWKHRFDEDPTIEWILGDCLRPLARKKEKAVLPLLFEYAEAGPGVKHTHLKDACIYSLTLGRYSAILDEYLTDERFKRWMMILQDLEEHPRFRAGFFPLLENVALSKERKKILSGIALGYTLPPHDSNLRSKAALHALLAGDRGALGPVYRLAMERDHPWWVFHNAFSGIAAFHGARDEPKEGEAFKVPVEAARALLDIMAGGLKCMEPYSQAEIVHVNNYYHWGIQYKIFPPKMCARVLKEITKQEEDFGADPAKWRAWLQGIEKKRSFSPSKSERVIKSPYFSIRFDPGLDADAGRIRGFMEHAVNAMLDEFSNHNPMELLKSTNCVVHLYGKPNEKVSESRSLIEAGMRGGSYFANLHFLAPSAHSESARTNVGEPKDDIYFLKTIVHEYSTVILDRITRRKPKGWRFFNAPRWFVQGYEEYLGLMKSSKHSRETTFAKYVEKLRTHPGRISFNAGIHVTDPYIDGALLLAFFHETYGKERVQAILLSPEDTFEKAFIGAINDDLAGCAVKFRKAFIGAINDDLAGCAVKFRKWHRQRKTSSARSR